MMYVWLKNTDSDMSPREYIYSVRNDYCAEGEKVVMPEIKKDSLTGKEFIEVYDDPLDPSARIPVVPDEVVLGWSLRKRIRADRKSGIYSKGGATLFAEKQVEDNSFGGYQVFVDIGCYAPTLEDLRDILLGFRKGELVPDKDFDADQAKPTPAPSSSDETN